MWSADFHEPQGVACLVKPCEQVQEYWMKGPPVARALGMPNTESAEEPAESSELTNLKAVL